MNIAIIKQGVVTDCLVFEDLETAMNFLNNGYLSDVDDVQELPNNFAIGDKFENNEWVKTAPINPLSIPKTQIEQLQEENQQLRQMVEESANATMEFMELIITQLNI